MAHRGQTFRANQAIRFALEYAGAISTGSSGTKKDSIRKRYLQAEHKTLKRNSPE